MATFDTPLHFDATLQRPAKSDPDDAWAFVILPRTASETLPRRGRTTVAGTLNGQPFQATLEPDGRLSHWFEVAAALCAAAAVTFGDHVSISISPVKPEPEPTVPADLRAALSASTKAQATWNITTTLARVDWIHWVESARQSSTRVRRIRNACAMLASGKGRVCCFDPSGFYSKSLSAPAAAKPVNPAQQRD